MGMRRPSWRAGSACQSAGHPHKINVDSLAFAGGAPHIARRDAVAGSRNSGLPIRGTCRKDKPMDFEKYTERTKGFVQAAQTLAQRSSHQRLTPEHLLKVLLDDKEGLASNLMQRAGADPANALQRVDA